MRVLIDGQVLVDSFVALLPQDKTVDKSTDNLRSTLTATDNEVHQLVNKMCLHDLWGGNWNTQTSSLGNTLSTNTVYPSQSEADFALLNAIANTGVELGISDEALLNVTVDVFMRSGMYRPEKHNTILNNSAPKAVAIAVQGKRHSVAIIETKRLPRLDGQDGVVKFSDTPPTPRVYVLQDLIVAVKVCVLAGLGGVSKTMLAMQWAVCIALGLPYMGKATLAGAVMLILGEEDSEEIARRFNAIVKSMKLSDEQIALAQRRIRAFPMNGLDSRLTSKKNGSLEGTEFTAEVITASKSLETEAEVPLRLIVLDHAGLIHGGEFNSREDVVQTMRQVNFIAQESQASVMILAHSPKNAVGKDKADSNDVAGSAAWVDLARAVFVLRTMDDTEGKKLGVEPDSRKNYASLSIVKNNYGPTGDTYWLQRVTVENYGVSVLNHVDLVKPIAPMKGGAALQKLIISKITEHTGKYSKTGFVEKYRGEDGPLKATKREVQFAVDELLSSGEIVLREPTTDERTAHRLHQSVKEVLVVKS